MSAAYIKMINGEELIARVVHEDEECYIFSEPMIVEQRTTASGSTIDVLVNYVNMSDDKDIEIQKSHIIFVANLANEYEKYYSISKTYYSKYVRPNLIEEVTKVTDAMEDVLFNPSPKPKESKIVSTSANNNTLH